jgi:hypothetical protein
MKALAIVGFICAVYALVLWLRHIALRDAISNPFDFEDHE